jgi:hypothetical protein
MTTPELHHEKWHGFDIWYWEDDSKLSCLAYGCRVREEDVHAFDLRGAVDAVAVATREPQLLAGKDNIREQALARARALIDLRSFEWGQTLERSPRLPRTSDNRDVSDQGLRMRLLEVFYTIRRAIPRAFDLAEGRVDVSGLCAELDISENQYLSAVSYLLEKLWVDRIRVRLGGRFPQVFITGEGIDEYERQASLGDTGHGRPEQPDFSFISHSDLRSIIERDYAEIPACLATGAWKAATVMCGSVMEAVLFDALLGRAQNAKQCEKAPKDKGGKVIDDLGHWSLKSMIEVAIELKMLRGETMGLTSHAVREYRNLIHPAAEVRKGITAEKEEAKAAKAALDLIIKQLA